MKLNVKRIAIFFISGVIIVCAGLFFLVSSVFAPTQTTLRQDVSIKEIDTRSETVREVASDLDIPWDIIFLPNEMMLVSERPGTIQIITQETGKKELVDIEGDFDISADGEGGLLGITAHPDFDENGYIYIYKTYQDNSQTFNRIVRYTFSDQSLTNPEVIIEAIPGAKYHDGGRMAFGPDGYLYVTTGDAGVEALARDQNSLAGKILRLGEDGAAVSGNPYDSEVYSQGHRNPQGLAWDEDGRLYSSEHGRSGFKSGMDEVNRIEIGGDYRWPQSEGDTVESSTIGPIAHSGADETWAPASLMYWDGSLWFGGLRGETLYEAKLTDGGEVQEVISHFRKDFGRVRTVALGPDNFFYLTTSNTDGRGDVREGDDKIIRVDPKIFR